MSSNRLNILPGDIKIKTEPGTSTIKIEPGTSQRLSSLKLPRDLKLGGSKAKVIKPNLNVVRNKRNDVPNSPSPHNRGRGRGRGRSADRGRGAPRGRPSNTVQSYGVFSEGIAETLMKRASQYSDRFREDKDYDAAKVMDKPTINKNMEWKVDKDHEDMIMNELLNVHIDPEDIEGMNDLHPVTLPVSLGVEQKSAIKLEKLIKTENEPFENGVDDKKLFETQEKLLLFQFPDSLPGIGPATEPETSTSSTSSTNNENSSDTEKIQTESKCTLRDVDEGLLGKIVIYKSGKTKLIIGNSKFDIEIGPDAGFLQDVMSVPVNTATKSGDMINLGSVDGNVIVSPEWDNLLQSE